MQQENGTMRLLPCVDDGSCRGSELERRSKLCGLLHQNGVCPRNAEQIMV